MGINSPILATLVAVWLIPMTVQLPVPGEPAASTRTAASLDDAEKLMQTQRFAEAEKKLQILAAEQAKNPQFWFDLGFAQSHQKKTAEAISSYRKAVRLAPTWFEANLNLGLALAQSGDSAGAVPVLHHAVELKPVNGGKQALSKAWEALADVLAQSDPRGAAGAYDKAADMNPETTDSSLKAGRMLQKAGDLAAAEQHFRSAAIKENPEAMVLLINLLNLQKRYSEAKDWLERYIAKEPHDNQARVQLAKLFSAEGKYQDAIAVLEPGEKSSSSPELKRQLADLYLASKKYQQAEPMFRDLVQKNGSDAELHFGLGIALLYQLKYADAESELIQGLKLKSNSPEAYEHLADAASANNHYPLAIQALDARSKYLPETPRTIFIRAICYDHLRMTKRAIANYKQFLTVAGGKFPDQEFQARHRLKALEPE